MRSQHGAASWTLWRVRVLQRISRMQVRKAELHWSELPAMRRGRAEGWGVGREESTSSRQHLLRLLELPEVRVHVGIQTCGRAVSGVWKYVLAGEEYESRHLPGV